MRKLVLFAFGSGILMLLGAGMLAFDDYITDDRRAKIQGDLNARIDQKAAAYDENRDDGCVRRCGVFASMGRLAADMRDGMMMSLPFDPDAVFPQAPDGWVMSDYDLATVEGIVDHTYRRSAVHLGTENSLLKDFERISEASRSGAIRIYAKDDLIIAMAIKIHPDAIRDAKDGIHTLADPVAEPFALIKGLPVRRHPQVSYDRKTYENIPVAYRHFSMNFDQQAEILILALAEDADIAALLAGLDVGPIVNDLPLMPAGYVPYRDVAIAE